jgi:hypothetical protein
VIGDNQPIFTSLADVAGEDVPASIEATQQSLGSAASAAKLVDDTVATLASLPFMPRSENSSPFSLHGSLTRVSEGLESLSASFKEVEAGLNSTADNLDRARRSMVRMADDMDEVQRSLADARAVVVEYQDVVARAQVGLPAFRANLPGWIQAIRLVLSLALVWLGIMQIGLLAQGAGMLRGGVRRTAPDMESAPALAAPPPLRALPAGASQALRSLTSRTTVSR